MPTIRRWTLIGRLFMCAWVLFGLPTAVSVAASGLGPTQLAIELGFAAWAVVWFWLWIRVIGNDRVGSAVGLVASTALFFMFSLIEPQPAGTFLVFSFIVAGCAFPVRQAVWIFVALVVIQTSLLVVRLADPASAVNSLINSILVGGVGIGLRLLWLSYTELVDAREEIARLAVSEERLRFARDVHDLLGQSLAMIVLKSELVARQLPADVDDSLRHELQDVVQVGRKSLSDLREAVTGYRRPSLSGEISSARSALRAAGIVFAVDDQLGTVPPELDAVLAWCLREAVTNVVKHSGARRCVLSLSRDGVSACLEITDDGRGATSLDGGNGLAGMRERVELAGGALEAGPDARGGFRLAASVPMAVAAERAAS